MKVRFVHKDFSGAEVAEFNSLKDFIESEKLKDYAYFIMEDKDCFRPTKIVYENEELLKLILQKQITMFYQPIFSNKNGFVYAFEALLRVKAKDRYIYPKEVFDLVHKIGIGNLVDAICREQAIMQYKQKKLKLFININQNSTNANIFKRGYTLKLAIENGFNPEDIVLEITESEKIEDVESLKDIIHYYKNLGFSVAFDDFGTGYNSLKILSQIEPDYIKFPIELINGMSRSKLKWQIVRGIMDMAIKSGIKTIAEGVEKKEDLEAVLELGIDYTQGFLLGLPTEAQDIPKDGIVLLKTTINEKKLNSISDRYKINKEDYEPVEVLEEISDTKSFIEYLKKSTSRWLYIKPMDILVNENCAKRILNAFQENLFYYKDLDYLFENIDCHYKKPMSIDVKDNMLHSYYVISEKHMDVLLVKYNDEVLGVLSKSKILERLFDTFYKMTLYTNPLTGLPGNVLIEKEIDDLISQNVESYVVYIDISNFKPFNDAYGFLAGDMMIKKLAHTLQNFASSYDAFIGHVGGDDFVVIFKNLQNPKEVIENLYKEASEALKELYSEQDIQNGYFVSKDREGNIKKFPIAKITLAAVSTKNYKSSQDISKRAAELKKESKTYLMPIIEDVNDTVTTLIKV